MTSAQIRTQFGNNVRKARRNRAQDVIAEQAMIPRSYLSSIECGKKNVGVEVIVRLAFALGVAVADLFEGIRI